MSKFFLVTPNIESLDKAEIMAIESSKQQHAKDDYEKRRELSRAAMAANDNRLKCVSGRVVIKADKESKNEHNLNGVVIRRERQFNEFNKRISEPVNAFVVSAENIPMNAEILISHNALHDSNLIFDYVPDSGITSNDVKFYSIPEGECFAWRDEQGKLQPMKNFCFALRVFEPYKGTLAGIEPTVVKEVLFITTGEFAGNIVHTLKASDYEIIYQGQDLKEERLVRCRHFENEINEREEITAVSHSLTKRLKSGELLIGLEKNNCKPLNEYKWQLN